MQDKVKLTEKELLDVVGGTDVEAKKEQCKAFKTKDECEAVPGCSWVRDVFSHTCKHRS